ncbi:Metallo-dependent phosphatase [Gigaspora margarita]|uniref:Metallo-dependent phosphatase n=2 Tax=Gigaspora margarita TaxID=4874 RepID=A0A8H4AHI7_GIGMA|nr:Metallo-dependent phosphatase [Gigaspora margarita]
MQRSLLPFILVPLTLLSWLRAYIIYHEAVSSLYGVQITTPSKNVSVDLPKFDNLTIGDRRENILYFMQVSDLHISKYYKPGGASHFLYFLSTALPVVSPSFVLVTGDLTDGKEQYYGRSNQIIDEWLTYQTALQESGVLDRPNFWYDMRGNHDCFDMSSWNSEQNLYRQYSVVKKRGFDFMVEKTFGRYRFIGIDACPKSGPSRPYNFFGYYEINDMDRLSEKLLDESSNHTFLLAHYPKATLLFGKTSKGEAFEDLSEHISVYMCGHLHKLALGLGDHLQIYRPTNYLELELGDMKVNAVYRILAIDHDLVSYIDVQLPLPEIPLKNPPPPADGFSILPEKLPYPPIILITNPKGSAYTMKYREPVQRIKYSTHIRMLIFSDHDIDTISIFLDGKLHDQDVYYKGNSRNDKEYIPLWTSQWSPSNFDDGKNHVIVVKARDISGQVGESKLIFRVDGERSSMNGGISEFLMGLDWAAVGQSLFFIAHVTLTIYLLAAKLYVTYYPNHPLIVSFHASKKTIPQSFFRKTFLLVSQPIFFYTLYFYLLAIITMPLFIGHMIPSSPQGGYGLFWIYGIQFFQNLRWLPLADTWRHAVIDFVFSIAIVVIWFLVITGDRRWRTKWLLWGVILWLWRGSELYKLSQVYGHFVFWANVQTFWWLFWGWYGISKGIVS